MQAVRAEKFESLQCSGQVFSHPALSAERVAMAGYNSADDLLSVMLSAELPSISDSGGQNTSHPSSHDHRLGGTQQELLLPTENLSEQEARWGREEQAKITSKAGLWEEDHGGGGGFLVDGKAPRHRKSAL